ncbi:MAG: hypothetical protein JNG85_00275, partial [Spirochaetaceae bacterium]|nr:hypothetical protein [Spirochaetaceae bacterium]
NGQAAAFVADLTTAATKQAVSLSNGSDYFVSATNIGASQITIANPPADGSYTLTINPFRIAGQPTKFRLPRLSGFVPAAAGDDDGQYSLNKRVMDRFESHYHGSSDAGNISTAGGNKTNIAAQGNIAVSTQWAQAPVSDGTNTLRTGKTTDPRAFGTFIGTWVRTLLATTWTSA